MRRDAKFGLGIIMGAVLMSALVVGLALGRKDPKPVVIPDEGSGRVATAVDEGGSASDPAAGAMDRLVRGPDSDQAPAGSGSAGLDVAPAGSNPGTLAAAGSSDRPGGAARTGSEAFGLAGSVPVEPAETAPATGGPAGGPGASAAAPAGSGTGARGAAAGTSAPADLTPPAGRDFTYTVQVDDSAWKIAKRFYGKGQLWSRLAEANPGVDFANLKAGTKLTIMGSERPAGPAAAGAAPPASGGTAAPASGASPAELREVAVQAGDTPYRLAEKHLGSGLRFGEILKLNPGLDPRSLKVGQKIRIPAR